jgi:hypothetical protein
VQLVRTFTKQIFFSLLLASPARAIEPWTDSLHVKEGIFAVRAEPGAITVVRADDRAGRNGMLRVKVARERTAAPLIVTLRRLDGEHAPWKYVSAVPEWDGAGSEIELEASDDGKRWRAVGVFRAP